MQNAPFTDPNSKRREVSNIVAAARAAGVRHLVRTSVSGAGAFHRGMTGFEEGRWSRNYRDSKAFAEDALRQAGFQHLNVLRPAFMMQNFLPPKSHFMFPDLANYQIVTAIWPQTRLAMVSGADVGQAAAFSDPTRLDGTTIELAGDACTMDEVARALSSVSGHTIAALSLLADDVIARGQFPGWVNTQESFNEFGYPANQTMPADPACTPWVLHPGRRVTLRLSEAQPTAALTEISALPFRKHDPSALRSATHLPDAMANVPQNVASQR